MSGHGWELTTPVVFIIFNRPQTTKLVLDEILKAKPPKIYVIADGPRDNAPADKTRCDETRALIENSEIDSPIKKIYSDTNMGCPERVISGLNWVFTQEDQAIILEDDCVPDASFFRYCDELLLKYDDDNRVMTISGDNFQFGKKRTKYSYYFSIYPHIWGWATWKRAWKQYDKNILMWPEVKENRFLNGFLHDRLSVMYWNRIFDRVYDGTLKTWDYQWVFSSWMNNAFSIIPHVNLISNVGFGQEATLTKKKDKFSNIPSSALEFPLHHPPYVMRNWKADRFTQKDHFSNIPRMCFNKISSLCNK
ncbi:MAG TPA: hypothetical protein PLN56_07350 [Methanoregulaceae archaeon]|nr:MAG: glycosyltransferase family 2 protein [Methanolinea sp.]HON82099.1 hypothetical protein [Methanoregulaceae archaeon]HPD10797.1 hypothetical protein [Methanoregulaceae archaeon]HRT15985.1 hypothetical protein [Methanoregulaceae archaeon]HRU31450.1 hypothetical protein [Methanoregulaceae archaeon]